MSVQQALIADASRFDFFEACRQLEYDRPGLPRLGDSATRRDEYARFGQDPHFVFAASNLNRAVRDTDGAVAVYVRFLGLMGPQGAMPLTLTDEAFQFERANDDALARFMDVFNNRFIQLFYRAWADARPISYRDRPASEDRFSAFLGSGIGLGSQAQRNLDSVDDMAKIGFVGLLGAKTKSASRLSQVLSALLGPRVEIEEFVGIRLMFEPDQRSRVGRAFATLGRDILLGAAVYSVQDKIRIRVFADTLAQFEGFLPVGTRARALADLVHFYLGLELQWDVELCLPASEVRGMTLGTSGRLGWTSWLSPNWAVEARQYRADARFDLAGRFPPGASKKQSTKGRKRPE
ncbi:MAG: type VI secretion system baseplate subunit TssG [Hyphomicrobiales bacterium]|nr:type VI secretion system baseplate subunit TssG [Hyphomicrobiales bacterium]